MPDRIVRDELLRSHRYVTLSSDTSRLLFIHLVLSADSLGNAEATTTSLGIIMGRPVDAETASKWLTELADVDLIRVYEAQGKRYVHIPRFRQRLRYLHGKHPRPPENIECNELKDLLQKVGLQSDHSRTTVRPQSAEVKRSEVKRSEEKKDLDLNHLTRDEPVDKSQTEMKDQKRFIDKRQESAILESTARARTAKVLERLRSKMKAREGLH